MNYTPNLNLYKWNSGDKASDTITEISNNMDKIDSSLSQIAINVKSFGAKGDGTTDDTTSIQNTINASPVGSVILFPAGTYMISSPIVILPNRTYKGAGWGSTIKQMDGKNMAQMIQFATTGAQYSNVIIRDLQLDGNKANNTSVQTSGYYLFGLLNSMLYRLRVQNCKGSGYFIDGNDTYNASTNHIIDCWAFSNDGYGLYPAGACLDTHIIGGDYGLNFNSACYLAGSSCSIRNAVFWGTQNGSCMIVTGAGNQITDNNIEGAAGHGVEVRGNHNLLDGNKIYDNANTSTAYGQYDGIFVTGADGSNLVENVILTGNQIYAGLFNGTSGYYRYGVNLGWHKNCEVNGNNVRYAQANGTMTKTNAIYGLGDQDIYEGTLITTTANRPTSAPLSQKAYDITLNKPIYWNGSGWKDSTGATV